MRQNADLTSSVFNAYSDKIVKQIIDHYKNNPTVFAALADHHPYYKAVNSAKEYKPVGILI